jgi:hypothetical protein
VADYQERRAALRDPDEAQRLLGALFTPEERLRVKAVERVASGTP